MNNEAEAELVPPVALLIAGILYSHEETYRSSNKTVQGLLGGRRFFVLEDIFDCYLSCCISVSGQFNLGKMIYTY